jgi:hypothetical protein
MLVLKLLCVVPADLERRKAHLADVARNQRNRVKVKRSSMVQQRYISA